MECKLYINSTEIIYMYMYIYIHTHIYIIYICICIYIHTHIYILYIYIWRINLFILFNYFIGWEASQAAGISIKYFPRYRTRSRS